MHDPATKLVIFDCDGVLVDSEPISVEVMVAEFEKAGVAIDEDYVYRNFLGRSMATVVEVAHEEFSFAIGDTFLTSLRTHLYRRFRQDLKPISGLHTALDDLGKAGVGWCVASSSQPDRIALSLSVTGLIERFEPHIFSATMVKNGKPAPDLFLYAAEKMGIDPHHCVVVEDSPAGLTAARAAGMRALAFTGGGHATGESYHGSIDALKPDAKFDVMANLVQFVL
ncbi:HAD family hydrolase [Agrobacterium vitis]|uniref:HAD family hydrolase n=1 Tax=Agrobacterium vitis TaxID=373 RepID=A0AAE5AUF5_AGRVI|nr:HAD family hydrolase [Agrobacterium vitis]MCF1497850.1 HAD family hydrolase [Allorhizobium sp. Av2]MBF2715106.1 HAD family hydrolase [Agrobacterium vitis]MCM2438684.1 HAD family hydrolase [Agrobacterium vitis]MUZ55990.1 HAD-IA family hydrolase [Agrobacterium vitis]MVA64872.1 HAD-IA family hydrolase [Agrobacterium vitis]